MTKRPPRQSLSLLTFAISRLMPVWILVCATLAFQFHSSFTSFQSFISVGIGCVMFLMGISLNLSRLAILLKNPFVVIMGSLGKWIFGSTVAVGLTVMFFGLHSETGAGIVMSGIVPSGTSANLNSLIGGGDIAYSVTMSALDTFVGPVITPLLAKICVGTGVRIEYFPFLWKMVHLVFLPLVVGIVMQKISHTIKSSVAPLTPILSALALYGIVLGIVSGASETLLHDKGSVPLVLVVVMMQVSLQMGIGYFYGKSLRLNESGCRSLLFEVGISNSALAAVLANSVFGPLAAVAAIVNMVCNLTLGSLVAALLKQRKIDDAHRTVENSCSLN